MARRRNSIAKRFAKMRGLPPEEKALLQRVADLMDAALNNRQASNPFEPSTTRLNRQVYPPTGLLAQTGVGSVKLVWDPANSNEHLRYEIELVNLTTGARFTKTSYTNYLIFKGPDGTYLAKVSSVGRDGSRSAIKQVEFGMGNDLMLIEGAKNGPTELGTVVQDNMQLFKDFSIYVWGSVVLDKQTLDTNNRVVFRLWRAEEPDYTWAVGDPNIVLQETITLYPATESGSSLDTTARAGLISRPIMVRPGAFETSQSVMFSPLEVADVDDGKTVTYFLQAINRETEADEVCLSLTMWAGQDGVGSAVPGDVFVPEPPYIFPSFNSYHSQGVGDFDVAPFDQRNVSSIIPDGFSLIGNQWSLAMWVRFDDTDATKLADETAPDGGNQIVFSRATVRRAGVTTNNKVPNEININLVGLNLGGGTYQHQLQWTCGRFNAQTVTPTTRLNRYTYTASGDRKEKSALFPFGDAQTASNSSFDAQNNGWYFWVFVFEGGEFTDGVPKMRFYASTGYDTTRKIPFMELQADVGDQSVNPITQTDEGKMMYNFGPNTASLTAGSHRDGEYVGNLRNPSIASDISFHKLGMWNTALDSTATGAGNNIGQIEALLNDGRGWAVDWKRSVDAYIKTTGSGFTTVNTNVSYDLQESIVHLIQFGAVEEAFQTLHAIRDSGYPLPGGEMNMLQIHEDFHQLTHAEDPPGTDRFHQIELPSGSGKWFKQTGASWTDGTDIYDVLSPLGTNGTTQYDYAYPGQQQVGVGGVGTDGGRAVQPKSEYPSFADWVFNGSHLTDLPWVAGPYPPGYHKDDPARPIEPAES